MKLCFLSHEYPKHGLNPGGIGIFLKTLAPELVRFGNKVTVLGANNSNSYEEYWDQGVRVIRIPNPKIPVVNWWVLSRRLKKKIIEIAPDIVEGSELSFAFLSKIPGAKKVIRLHGGHHFFAEAEERKIDAWKGYQEKRSFKNADAFIAISDYVRNHTSSMLSFHGKPVVLIRNIVDTNRFYFSPKSSNPNPRSLIFLGTVCEKKGVGNLVKAIDLVRAAYPEVHLGIYGRDWEFPDGRSYKALIRNQIRGDLEKHISIHDAIPHDQVPGIYRSAEICIFPSFMETQGLVAPEAMAMGKIVIFTNKGPGPETIQHGVNGYLCDPHDVHSIVEAIEEAFESSDRKEELAGAARARVLDLFGIEKNLDENIRFYRKILHG
ncbi:glycosyltransferase family 4 protein [Algoriphagus aestuariicola]|jgi:glycosyltransferase involved in cell wall biosynthesis|uniref:Glycosyltransferase family 4 protein n=1 Tax=Algoriphagus aestuariicola TaxID=1852016 RepID=A0ABS3BLI4_9BACT|nr:glycosyltransferase family 4 protein [Algoriphagus aestuariicola]MBN7799910.1 glycosyltransferase family 4 protein [Algoriphagus aestuariicola]